MKKTGNKQLKRYSLISLIAGYTLAAAFIILILFNRPTDLIITDDITPNIPPVDMFVEHEPEPILYPVVDGTRIISPPEVYIDRLQGVVIDNDPIIAVVENDVNDDIIMYENKVHRRDIVGDRDHTTIVGRDLIDHDKLSRSDRVHIDDDVDIGLLDRRLADLDTGDLDIYRDIDIHGRDVRMDKDRVGLIKKDDSIDLGGLTLARDDDFDELGDVDIDINFGNETPGEKFGVGKGGQLYAYNYPSRGVGAGIGNSAIGAGAGGGAGLSAGIGQGISNGETVPTLGGVGTYTPPGATGPSGPMTSGGSGGLVAGAGSGGAAGLTTGQVMVKLGVGPGAPGLGGYGRGGYNYDHLPKDGALHIMMHVDGSGSILNTRKQLDLMKDTLLKTALLPYYNNDEDLYNRRVTIVSNSGERTLQFFTEAARKDNVLAIAFQDEAQPSYHLPTFNKKPQDHYSKDLANLKASLNGYGGIYRGVMFQVDRGKTFAKSFKEFVGSAFRGEGYLESSNLKKFYRDNNTHHIRNRDGVVFSDEYHAKDAGDPQYYLNLILDASKRIGLDLNIQGAGLSDGKYNRVD